MRKNNLVPAGSPQGDLLSRWERHNKELFSLKKNHGKNIKMEKDNEGGKNGFAGKRDRERKNES